MNIGIEMSVAMIACALLAGYAWGAEEVDDSVIAALDAEIAAAGEDGDGRTGSVADELKADDIIKSIEAEMTGLDAKDFDGGGRGIDKKPASPSQDQQSSTGNRSSKGSKGVIMHGRGRGKTKESAERVACWNAVFGALRKYAGEELVKEKYDAVKKLVPKVAEDVIDKHEVVEEKENDGQYAVKVKAWIRKQPLAAKFAEIFPETFPDAEEDCSSSNTSSAGALATKDQSVVVVTVTGKGETKDEAKRTAFRVAVEKAVGAWIDAESIMKNNELLKNCVNKISNADIKRCETLDERKESSGLYVCKIKAWVEKKAIAPKFQSVFPAAFKDIGEAAETIHAHRITRQERAKDAASLMAAALDGVDRMRNWTRLSVVKGKALEEVKKIGDQDVAEVPGKGLYSVRYSITVDMDAYFKGFLPHFKEMLSKMQEGESDEDVVLSSGPVAGYAGNGGMGGNAGGHTYFVDHVALSGFPGAAIGGIRGKGGNPEFFMFDQYKGLTKVQDERTFNIWLLDKMNKDRTVVRCSAYKVPASALRAYWKSLYGELDSSYAMKGSNDFKMRSHEKVEVVLLDEEGEEIAAQVDNAPAMLLASGFEFNDKAVQRDHSTDAYVRKMWEKSNVFNSFFIRPMFAHDLGLGRFGYSPEIQRDVYFPLTDSQLGRVKKVKVRYVGGRKR